MKRFAARILIFTLTAFVLLAAHFPVAAKAPLLSDGAGLLDGEEREALDGLLTQIQSTYRCDLAVVTVESLEGRDAREAAISHYEEGGYAEDGALFLLSISDREWYFLTTGVAKEVFPESILDRLEEELTPLLAEGRYYEAFRALAQDFALELEDFQGEKPDPEYGEGENLPEKTPTRSSGGGFPFGTILFSLLGGGVLAGITVWGLLNGRKTVKPSREANRYVRPGSFQMTANRDIFLYRTVSRREKPQNHNSSSSGRSGGSHGTHVSTGSRSSGGHSYGGRGGRF